MRGSEHVFWGDAALLFIMQRGLPGGASCCSASKPNTHTTHTHIHPTHHTPQTEDPVNSYLLGGGPCPRFARKEIKGYLKALPAARHFVATPDAAAVALWQLVSLLAGWCAARLRAQVRPLSLAPSCLCLPPLC